jgi:hypothetical protein
MSHNVVLLPVIPGAIQRGPAVRSDVEYARYAVATWMFWCRQHDVELVLLDRPQIEEPRDAELAPTIQRWIAVRRLLEERQPGTRIAMVDADTMVRWNAPDLFATAGVSFAAVRDWGALWIHRSIKAYQHLFPDTALPWWDYINAGMVVLGAEQLPIVRSLVDLARRRWPELRAIQESGDYGTDQTILNFLLKRANEHVTLLPPPFNCLMCFPLDHELLKLEKSEPAGCAEFASKAFGHPENFDFIDMAYVWHFTNVVACRRVVMEETWRRIRHHYPGVRADLEIEVVEGV